MNKKPLIGVSISVVILLVLASLSNAVGYQTVEFTNQKTIDNMVDQKELVFQTFVDIASNEEIQGVLLRYQVNKGEFPGTIIPVITMKHLRQMYVVGLILSKTISKAKMYSMIEKYVMNNRVVQKEINAVIQKDTILNKEMKRLSCLGCDCENENTIQWTFPIVCTILFPIFIYAFFLWAVDHTIPFVFIIGDIGKALNCFWSVLAP